MIFLIAFVAVIVITGIIIVFLTNVGIIDEIVIIIICNQLVNIINITSNIILINDDNIKVLLT